MVERDKNLYADVLSYPTLRTERSNMAGRHNELLVLYVRALAR